MVGVAVLFGFQNTSAPPQTLRFATESREILSGVTLATGFVYEPIRALWVCSYWVEWRRITQTPLSVPLSVLPLLGSQWGHFLSLAFQMNWHSGKG